MESFESIQNNLKCYSKVQETKYKMAFSKTIKNYKMRWNDFKRCVNVQGDIAHRLINLFKFLELLGNSSCSRTLQNCKKNRWNYDMRYDNLIPRMITACC